jgi:RimJ/RimL family protein N-acetyltransferase
MTGHPTPESRERRAPSERRVAGARRGPETLFHDTPSPVVRTVLFVDLVESVRLMEDNESAVVRRWQQLAAAIERDILPRFLASYDEIGEFGRWAAIEKATGEFLGWFSFRSHDDAHLDDVELGYRLRQASWGRGYATEGVQALIRRGFTDLGVRRVYATTYQDNRASRRVMEKVGLTFVRAYRPTPDEVAAVGTFQPAAADVWDGDEVEYALEKSAWERHEAAGAPPVARADNRGIA